MANKYLQAAERVLEKNSRMMSVGEIWDQIQKEKIPLESDGKTPWASLGASLYTNAKKNDGKFFSQGNRPKVFGLKVKKYSSAVILPQSNPKPIVSKDNERVLHPLLSAFVHSNGHFEAYTKTIYHEKSNREKAGLNKWIHPDIVGVYFPFNGYKKETLELLEILQSNTYKLFSFELKWELLADNYKEYYFQAVSNSSWAHEGYLVAPKIDMDIIPDLERLGNAFGIGIIKLDVIHPQESELLVPARTRSIIDSDTLDMLVEKNDDFKIFVDRVLKNKKTNEVTETNYDKILTDEDLSRYITEHNKIFQEKGLINKDYF